MLCHALCVTVAAGNKCQVRQTTQLRCLLQEYPDFIVVQAYAGGHFVAVDLAKAPANFELSSLFFQYNFDLTDRATADSCAACGLCKKGEACPLVGKAFPDNPPDFCAPVGSMNNTAVNGPFTWSITVV